MRVVVTALVTITVLVAVSVGDAHHDACVRRHLEHCSVLPWVHGDKPAQPEIDWDQPEIDWDRARDLYGH